MKFLEKDLEEIIYESHKDNKEQLHEKGLPTFGKMHRQLRIGNYGIADLVTFNRCYSYYHGGDCLKITVYELKKEKAGISAFLQAVRYCKGISEYIKFRNKDIFLSFEIVLCAKEIDTNSDFIFLNDFMSNSWFGSNIHLSCYSYNYGLNGIKFKLERGYSLTNNGFKL